MAWIAGLASSAVSAIGGAASAAGGAKAAGTAAKAASGGGALSSMASGAAKIGETASYLQGGALDKGSMLNDGANAVLGKDTMGMFESIDKMGDKESPTEKAKAGEVGITKVNPASPGEGGTLSSFNRPSPVKFKNGKKVNGGY
jgi:hypothetical protein